MCDGIVTDLLRRVEALERRCELLISEHEGRADPHPHLHEGYVTRAHLDRYVLELDELNRAKQPPPAPPEPPAPAPPKPPAEPPPKPRPAEPERPPRREHALHRRVEFRRRRSPDAR